MRTIKIENLKAKANALLRDSANEMAAQRKAVHYFVSDLLMNANAYKGFRYLEACDVEPGKSIGLIRATEEGAPHSFPDDSRTAFL